MMLRRISLWLLIGFLLAACSSTPPPLEVSLQASEFRYGPSTIEVQAGQQLTVTMENMGTVEHDFVIQEMPMEQGSAKRARPTQWPATT